MTTLTETTYAFINNNLHDASKNSTMTEYKLIQNETNNETTHHLIKQSLGKEQSVKKLISSRSYFSRICNLRNDCGNNDIQLTHIRSYTPDNNKHALERCSLSQNSSILQTASQSSMSSSSSSSEQLSPITTPKAPLLGTNCKRNINKSKILKDNFEGDNTINEGTQINCCDRYEVKGQSKLRGYTCHRTNITQKLHSPPLSGLKMKAKRVWNVLERKINSNTNSKGISQSKSVGNLQYTSTVLPTFENLTNNHKNPDVKGEQVAASKHQIQNDHNSSTNLVLDKSSKLSFPHSKSFEISKQYNCSNKLSTTLSCNKQNCTNRKLSTNNHNNEKTIDNIYPMGILPHQSVAHNNDSCSHPRNHTYCTYENITEKLTNSLLSKYYNNKQLHEICQQNCLHSRIKNQLSCMKCSENCIFIIPTGLPFQEVREICLTRPEVGQRFGMRIEKVGKGTYLTTVLPGSVASQAGLKIGDEILQVNGISIQSISINSINQLVRSTRQLKIAYRPRTILTKIRFITVKKVDGRVGIRLKRTAQGLYVDVVLPNSAASEAGIKEGDELICVNNQIVTSWTQEAASKLLRELPDEELVVLHFREFFHSHVFNDRIQFIKQHNKTLSIKENLSVPHCSTVKLKFITNFI
ncbi:Protein scribble [Schistosoma japonicum]|nr:Protein scribble [Schistosoma japonicum]KAH8863139.1 Protein scribble [Schistosoma japonicum]